MLAPLGHLLLPVQLPVDKADALLQHFAQLGIALQDQLHGLFRNHQQPRIRAGDSRRDLFLAHHAGALAKNVALAQGRQRILDALLGPHDADFALAHHVQAAVFPCILLQDLLAGGHALHAHAAHGLL